MDNDLYLYWNPAYDTTGYYGRVAITYRYLYNLIQAKNEIIKVTTKRKADAYYISPKYYVKQTEVDSIEQFSPPPVGDSPLLFYKFKKTELLVD